MSTFFRPTPNTRLKSVALASFLAGFIDPALTDNDAWTFNGATLAQTAVSGVAGAVASGYLGAVSDGAAGAWLSQISGAVVHLTSGFAATAYGTATGVALTGLAYLNAPYILGNDGSVRTVSGASVVPVTPSFGGPALGAAVSGSTVFTLLPSAPALGWLTISSLTSGASGSATTPMAYPSCIAATASAVAVGGWNYATLASGFTSMAINPNGYTALLGATPGAGAVSTWSNSPAGTWSFGSVLTGLGTPSNVAWAPNGLRALASDSVAGNVFGLTYSLGLISLAQTLSISGAGPMAVAPDSVHALVCRTAGNVLTPLTYSGSTWSPGTALTIGGPSAIAMVSASGAVVGCVSGLAAATLSSSGIWSIGTTLAVGFTPTSLFVDPNRNIYAAGASGGSGYFAIATSGLALTASGSWTGSSAGIAFLQGQTVVGDPANNILRVFGPVGSTYSQYASAAAPSGMVALTLGQLIGNYQDLFAAGAASAWQYNFTAPYTPARTQAGMVSVYSAGLWSSVALPTGELPQCMAWNPSGMVSVYTLPNMLYTVTSGAVVNSTAAIAQAPGQSSTALLGISSLAWQGGHLYASSSLNDSLIEVL